MKARILPIGVVLILGLACSSRIDQDVDRAHQMVPGIPKATLRHLIASDDSTLDRHLAGLQGDLPYGYTVLLAWALCGNESFVETRDLLVPLMRRLERYKSLPDPPQTPEELVSIIHLSEEQGRRWCQIKERLRELQEVPHDQIEDAIAETVSLGEEYDSMGMPRFRADARLALLYLQAGNLPEAMVWTRRTVGEPYGPIGSAQLLGAVGYAWQERGEVDSMMACYDRAMEIATENHIASQAARLARFYAGYYRAVGRLALARRYFNDGLEFCDDFGGGTCEIRHRLALAQFYAGLGGWETARRLLIETRAIATQIRGVTPLMDRIIEAGMAELDGRYYMAIEAVSRADSIFRVNDAAIREVSGSMEYSRFQQNWARGLIDGGLATDALPHIAEARRIALERGNEEDHLAATSLLSADANLRIGNLAECDEHLDEFKGTVPAGAGFRDNWCEYDIILTRLHLAGGDTTAAVASLGTGVDRLAGFLRDLDGGVQSFLWLGAHSGLRDVAHDVFASDPSLACGFELMWAELSDRIGSGRHGLTSVAPAGSEAQWPTSLQERADSLVGSVSRSHAVCLLFVRHGDRFIRFEVVDGAVRQSDIDEPAGTLLKRLNHCWRALSTPPQDPDAPISEDLRTELRSLGEVLLPAELLTRSDIRTAVVTVDGALAAFPFEALDVGRGDAYHPLLSFKDVVYCHPRAERDRRVASSPGVVVADAACNALPGLDAAREEAEAVLSVLSGSVSLCGDDATRENLLSTWEGQRMIYAANHVNRDPEIPYLTVLPLTASDERRQSGFVDMADITAADLSACELVVLSGCSSGAPVVGHRTSAPGFGDAFLHAGAERVIQTFWDVPDDLSAATMTAFMNASMGDPGQAVKAINDVRRAAMKGPSGIRNPFLWAPFFAKTAVLP